MNVSPITLTVRPANNVRAAAPAPVPPPRRQPEPTPPAPKPSLGERLWKAFNVLGRFPTQFYFNHLSPSVPAKGAELQRFGDADVKEILANAKPGDLILWGSETSFVHGSVYMGNGEIVHALANNGPAGQDFGVVREKIADYVARVPRHRALITRPKDYSEAEAQRTMTFAAAQVGKDYDNWFRTGDDLNFYCTELVWAAVRQGPNKPDIQTSAKLHGLRNVVTTEDIRRSPDMVEVWNKNAPDLS
jgi:uncharacterized protein YycO